MNKQKEIKRAFLQILAITLLFFLGYTIVKVVLFNPYDLDFATTSSKIFDRKGEQLWEISKSNAIRNTPIDISTLPKSCIDGIVAIEDKSFWVNNGVDQKGLARLAASVFSGGTGGGSTISQQLIKNLFLNIYNRDPMDKYLEILYALKLNTFVSKEDILELYLNNIYFGELNYGIESASVSYFGKPASQLNLAECAYLVGIPQWPGIYNPYAKPEKGFERKDQILQAMLDQGFITEEEFTTAKETEITFSLVPSTIKAPHFVQFVGENLEKDLGDEIFKSHSIKTTYDYDLHQNILSILQNYVNSNKDKNINNSAAVVLDKDGNVLTMVGSVNFFDDSIDGKFNSALGLRQPGTLYAPLVNAIALGGKYTLDSEIEDTPFQLTIEEKVIDVANLDGSSNPTIKLSDAIQKIIPATRIAQEIGSDTIESKLKSVINFNKSDFKCDIDLLIQGCEMSLLDLVSLYAVNFGGQDKVRFVDSFEDDTVSEDTGVQLTPFERSTQITSLLPISDNGWTILFSHVSNDKDIFAIAFNQNYTVGVWSGNTKGEELNLPSGNLNEAAINEIINSLSGN